MAKIRSGSLAANIRGSIGGDTFSQNRYGTYVRKRAIPTIVRNPLTARVRNIFSFLTRAWNDLPEASRTEWREYASRVVVKDKFGENQNLTGHTMFIKCNFNLLRVGSDIITDPPEKSAPPGISTIGIGNVSSSVFEINTDPSTFDPDERLIIDAYVTHKKGITYCENKFRTIATISKTDDDPINILPYLNAYFGPIDKEMKVFLRIKVIDTSSGLESGYARNAFVYNW